MRPLTAFEQPIADAVVQLGLSRNWEFAAYLESPTGPLIELVTRMEDDRADPSSDVRSMKGRAVIAHHNHLSQESLSKADWHGASQIFAEIYAHCADGSIYYGKVIDPLAVNRVDAGYASHLHDAEQELFQGLLVALPLGAPAAELAFFFRKEVINRAMKLRNFVDYGVAWGRRAGPLPYVRPGNQPIPATAGTYGAAIANLVQVAAQRLSHKL